jgi:hypothetical protein
MGEAVARHSLRPLTSEGEAKPATRARSCSGKASWRLHFLEGTLTKEGENSLEVWHSNFGLYVPSHLLGQASVCKPSRGGLVRMGSPSRAAGQIQYGITTSVVQEVARRVGREARLSRKEFLRPQIVGKAYWVKNNKRRAGLPRNWA